MKNEEYHPAPYWNKVANRIKKTKRGGGSLAGDHEPYYAYKRKKFLKLLHSVDFNNNKVLEIGCGPGGNLKEIATNYSPEKLVGADISAEMLSLAGQNLENHPVSLHKVNGESLPFADGEFDLVFTATVLQHNTSESMLVRNLEEICRVCSDRLILFERVERKITGDDLCLGRPVAYYQQLVEGQGFKLVSVKPINVRVSYLVCGAIRKIFNARDHEEGMPPSQATVILQKMMLPVTRVLDRLVGSMSDVTKMEFRRVDR